MEFATEVMGDERDDVADIDDEDGLGPDAELSDAEEESGGPAPRFSMQWAPPKAESPRSSSHPFAVLLIQICSRQHCVCL